MVYKVGTARARRKKEERTVDKVRLVESLMNEAIAELDAEGFEPAILEGSKELLSNPILKHIVCEFNPNALASFGYTCDDILKYLADWDYREIFRYYDQNWDCVFTRKP
jgi:hypothetical protein